MDIHLTCQCGVRYRVDAKHLGERVRCPQCRRLLTVAEQAPSGVPVLPPNRVRCPFCDSLLEVIDPANRRIRCVRCGKLFEADASRILAVPDAAAADEPAAPEPDAGRRSPPAAEDAAATEPMDLPDLLGAIEPDRPSETPTERDVPLPAADKPTPAAEFRHDAATPAVTPYPPEPEPPQPQPAASPEAVRVPPAPLPTLPRGARTRCPDCGAVHVIGELLPPVATTQDEQPSAEAPPGNESESEESPAPMAVLEEPAEEPAPPQATPGAAEGESALVVAAAEEDLRDEPSAAVPPVPPRPKRIHGLSKAVTPLIERSPGGRGPAWWRGLGRRQRATIAGAVVGVLVLGGIVLLLLAPWRDYPALGELILSDPAIFRIPQQERIRFWPRVREFRAAPASEGKCLFFPWTGGEIQLVRDKYGRPQERQANVALPADAAPGTTSADVWWYGHIGFAVGADGKIIAVAFSRERK